MKFISFWCISFAILVSLVGCTSKSPLITVGLFNRTGGACESVKIELNGKSEELKGNVPNGNSTMTEDWPHPMPTNVTLRWITENQSQYSATLTLPKPSVTRPEFLDYDFVILPDGRANVIVIAWSGEPTDTKVENDIALQNKLCCNGGPNYRVAVKNVTGNKVDGLDIRFGPYAVNAGTYVDGSGQNYSIATGLPYPVTKSASLHWVTSGGHSWDKMVDLVNILPADLNDKCFWFILKENGNAEVQIVGWSDLRAGKYPDLCHGF
jgi:hypothetical protein